MMDDWFMFLLGALGITVVICISYCTYTNTMVDHEYRMAQLECGVKDES